MEQTALVADLQLALSHDELLAYYQPQVDVATGRIVAVEALCRWQHPVRGLLLPQAFIPLADGTELIVDIGRFMLDEACRAASEWSELGLGVEVAVNVSATQLAVASFFTDVVVILSTVDLDPKSLTIEITETKEIVDVPAVVDRLDTLRELGVGVSIDDFGTGFSSLEQLENLPATEVKIDRSLLLDTAVSAKSQLSAIVDLAHERGIRVVAEGVETPEQLELVRELEFTRVQGYLFGEPVTKAEIQRMLVEQVG